MRLIDADALREDMQWAIDHGMYDKPYDYLAEIDDAPTIGEWIPVSERLPSEKKAVLICDSGGNCFAGELVLTDTGYKWKIPLFTVWMDIEDGDAWMPLPEPYKGGEEE